MTRGPAKSFDREKVVKLAMYEFWKRGYAATSMTTLRDATGLGAKSLYDTYGNKRQLFVECLDFYGDRVIARTFDGLIAENPPKIALEKIVRSLVAVNAQGPIRGCLLGVTAAGIEDDPELSAKVSAYLDTVQAKLTEVIAQCLQSRQDDSKPSIDASELASMLMTLFQGIHIVSRAEPGSPHVQAAANAAIRLIDLHL